MERFKQLLVCINAEEIVIQSFEVVEKMYDSSSATAQLRCERRGTSRRRGDSVQEPRLCHKMGTFN